MLRKLVKDESGVALGLAVIMIVLIGVMGTGLLVFVQRDLQTVIEANQGQKALETAEAGAQAAKRHLLADAVKEDYDGGADSPWSASNGGVNLTFSGNSVNVQIKYLPPAPTASDVGNPAYAPVVNGAPELAEGRRYFNVIALGTAGEAKRKVEAIYHTADLNLPRSSFATNDITVGNNSTTISNASIFAMGDINGLRGDTLRNNDDAYGDWDERPWNSNPRTSNAAGAAAGGEITYAPSSDAGRDRKGTRDFDSTTTPRFVDNTWARANPPGTQPSGTISYPFDPSEEIDVESLKDMATVYHSEPGGPSASFTIGNTDTDAYPSSSSASTIYFVEFTGSQRGRVTFSVDSNPSMCNSTTSAGCPKGTIVVVNGNMDIDSASEGFEGVIIVRDPNSFRATAAPLVYENKGEFALRGFVNVEGDLLLRGSVNPLDTASVTNRPGFYNIQLWSWREVYE